MTAGECGMRTRRRRLGVLVVALVLASTGCQQKMAEMPYYKPYEPSDYFADHRSNRPLEPGVIHRGQRPDFDPLVTGLTVEEWGRAWKKADAPYKVDLNAPVPLENRENAIGAPRFDPRKADSPKIYNDAFPFEITAGDLQRGARQYTAFCVECHGPLGNGKGKIWERGYLKPTSYHTRKVDGGEPDESGDVPLGYSRGYNRWGIRIPLTEVPPGYIFEVITKGYGAMPDHAAQIKPDDRWRIIAYVRTLQFSMSAPAKDLPQALRELLDRPAAAGGKQQ